MGTPDKPKQKKPKGFLKLLWWYLKEDDGPIGWVLNIIVAFIVIKYLLLPGVGWVLGTNYPLVAVVSGSMEHNGGDFNAWWEQERKRNGNQFPQKDLYANEGITKEQFQEFRFDQGLYIGDLMLLKSPKEIMIGDVIVFNGNTKVDPIIHRVIAIEEQDTQKFYKTKGDDNCGSSGFEMKIPEHRLLGKSWVRIPYLGYVKLYFEKALRFLGLDMIIKVFR